MDIRIDLPEPSYYPVAGLKHCGAGHEYYWCTDGMNGPVQVWSWSWSNRAKTKAKWRNPAIRKIPGCRYLTCRVSGPGHPADGTTTPIHRLVLLAFGGPPPFPGAEVRHLDRDGMSPAYYSRNGVPRLVWGTRTQNEYDKRLHGTYVCGEWDGMSKLTTGDVLELLRLRKQRGLSIRVLGGLFGISHQQVWEIVNGRAWKHVPRTV